MPYPRAMDLSGISLPPPSVPKLLYTYMYLYMNIQEFLKICIVCVLLYVGMYLEKRRLK